MLSQLSYTPLFFIRVTQLLGSRSPNKLVGLGRLELPTSRLSGVRSNHLSYKPILGLPPSRFLKRIYGQHIAFFSLKGGDPAAGSPTATLLRLRPSRLPYRGRQAPLQVTSTPSGRTNSHGVTGGVYKTRERIHRGMLIRENLDAFLRFAQPRSLAPLCRRHCSTCVAQLVRAMMT